MTLEEVRENRAYIVCSNALRRESLPRAPVLESRQHFEWQLVSRERRRIVAKVAPVFCLLSSQFKRNINDLKIIRRNDGNVLLFYAALIHQQMQLRPDCNHFAGIGLQNV